MMLLSIPEIILLLAGLLFAALLYACIMALQYFGPHAAGILMSRQTPQRRQPNLRVVRLEHERMSAAMSAPHEQQR